MRRMGRAASLVPAAALGAVLVHVRVAEDPPPYRLLRAVGPVP